jgi:hypothetical protein
MFVRLVKDVLAKCKSPRAGGMARGESAGHKTTSQLFENDSHFLPEGPRRESTRRRRRLFRANGARREII